MHNVDIISAVRYLSQWKRLSLVLSVHKRNVKGYFELFVFDCFIITYRLPSDTRGEVYASRNIWGFVSFVFVWYVFRKHRLFFLKGKHLLHNSGGYKATRDFRDHQQLNIYSLITKQILDNKRSAKA